MRAFFLLLGVQVRSLLHALSPAGRDAAHKRTAGRVVLLVLAFTVLALLAVAYMGLLGIMLVSMGLANAIPAFAVLVSSLAGVVFTFMKVNGTLFGLADFDLVMALPIPRRTVVASRLAALFGSAIVTGAVFTLPLWVVYLALVNASAWTVLCTAAGLVLAPAIPTSIAIFLAFCLSAASSRFRHANLAYIVISLVAFAALFVGVYAFSFAANANGHEQTMSQVEGALSTASNALSAGWPPAAWLSRATATGDAAPFALFALSALAVTALTVEIVQRCYLAINGALSAGASRGSLSAEHLRSQSGRSSTPFRALVVKEYRTLLGVPSYAFNCLFGYLLMIVMAVALSVVGVREFVLSGAIDGVDLTPETYDAVSGIVTNLLPWAFVFCAIMSPSAACSVSMEGRSAWLMATAPLPVRTVLGAKLAANALPVAGSLAVSALVLLATGQVDALGAASVLVTGFGAFYATVNIGLGLDARRPNYSWTSPAEVVKRGFPITLVVIVGLVLTALGALIGFGLSAAAGAAAGLAWNLALGAVGVLAGQLIFRRTCATVRLML